MRGALYICDGCTVCDRPSARRPSASDRDRRASDPREPVFAEPAGRVDARRHEEARALLPAWPSRDRRQNRAEPAHGIGWEFLHIAIDDLLAELGDLTT